ncbi:MAG: universal stress protein [Betaproteobacteria bacterium]|nr:universal stress protein [Betaproteobacteria bacterium]MBI2292042.1 universal stress protein [Betaproteobacteria bacterium]MBI3054425.1 universal stress protein [Betaproteobacteria bacterium]
MYKHILIPTDGSALSRKAIVNGVKLAKALGAKVTGLFAAPPATPVVYRDHLPVGYMTPQQHAKIIEKAADNYLGVVERVAKRAGVRCECIHVTNDFPAEAILAIAKKNKCDLIFMASHGRRGLASVLLGSETQKVLTHSKIPVLVSR